MNRSVYFFTLCECILSNKPICISKLEKCEAIDFFFDGLTSFDKEKIAKFFLPSSETENDVLSTTSEHWQNAYLQTFFPEKSGLKIATKPQPSDSLTTCFELLSFGEKLLDIEIKVALVTKDVQRFENQIMEVKPRNIEVVAEQAKYGLPALIVSATGKMLPDTKKSLTWIKKIEPSIDTFAR